MLTMQGGDSLVGGLPIIHITYQQYIANPSAYHDPDVIVHISGYPTAGNLPADYVGYDSNLNMEDIGNIATKAIAKVEPSDTALYLHNVGTGFINKDGNYCITDVQIAVGGTIVLGTNCHVVDGGLSSNLTDIVDNAVSSSLYNGRVMYNDHLKIAQITLNVVNLTSGSTSWQTVTTNGTVFKAPLRTVYGKSLFGDFRIIHSPFSIDVNLRGASTTDDTFSCMYFTR